MKTHFKTIYFITPHSKSLYTWVYGAYECAYGADIFTPSLWGCGFESRLRQELSTTEVRPLSKAPNPQLLPGRRSVGCPLPQVCVCTWMG